MSKDAQSWDKCLPYAVLAYRTTPHTVTGYSPHYLMCGQELRFPIEDDLKVVIKKPNPGNYDEHVIDLAKKLKQVHEVVRKENKKGTTCFWKMDCRCLTQVEGGVIETRKKIFDEP